jgi:hypothetical protein
VNVIGALRGNAHTVRTVAVGASVAALVTAANESQGAYFSQSWGWVALAFLAAASLALILGLAVRPGAMRIAFAALIGALGVWVAISATWSLSVPGTLREAERMLVYVALAAAVALVLRRSDRAGVVGGVLAGIVVVASYAIATRLFPDRLESYDSPNLPYRLAEPIGYWNSLGLLAAMAILLGLGVVAHAKRLVSVAVAAACLPILAATLYFTFSRGAWAALAVGAVVLVALEAGRLRLAWCALAVAPASAICVVVASRYEALTTEDVARADAVAAGHRFAMVLALLVVASAAGAAAARWMEGRVQAPPWAERAVAAALVASALLVVVVGLVLAGGPRDALAAIENRFDTQVAVGDANLNERLFSASGNGRSETVGVAWDAGRERPLLGYGAGSYEYLWYERRPARFRVRDAHSLYAETFAELGGVGAALIVLAVLVPLVAAVRARRSRFVAGAAAAYSAWLVHAAIDWHWEVVGVTLSALLAAAFVLLAAEHGTTRPLAERARWPLLAISTGLTTVALVSLVGNQALFAGREALARKEWKEAREHARRAETLLPWSFEPYVVLGDAAAGLGDRQQAYAEYKEAVETDPLNWTAWLRFAQVARGQERRAAYIRVHQLNPRQMYLVGAPADLSPP